MSDTGRPATYYSPEPHYRPAWAQHLDEPGGTSWPGVGGGSPGDGRRPEPPRAPFPLGAVLAVGILSAIVGSGGTYLLLASGGQIERPAASGTPGALASATPTLPATLTSSDIVEAAARLSPAVVTITSIADFDPSSGAVPQVGVGSGVIYAPSGVILTNCHVVKGGAALEVALQDGRTFEGQVYGIDTLTDLAIVTVDATGLPAAPIGDSAALQPGQTVIAIGSPLGTYTNSVTSGIISALGRSISAEGPEGCNDDLHNLVQTDAAINFGNSGGALADTLARVVAINTAIATRAEGIGFAIPINIAKPIMAQALEGRPLARPYIGIIYVAVDPQVASQQELSIDFGALIAATSDGRPGVVAGGPGAEAGLREGDVITAIDGVRIDASNPLDEVLAEHAPGDTVTLEVVRDGRTMTLALTLGTRPADL